MSSINPELLERYFQGNCTPKEKELVDRWFASEETESKDDFFESDLDKKQLRDELWNGVKPKKSTHTRLIYLKAAAMALIFLSAGLLIYKKYNSTDATQYRTVEATAGQTKKLILEDGTRISLNGKSQVKIPETFDSNERVILLTGEAYLKVAKNPNRPFKVKTRTTTITVLGTMFNVKAYAEDDHVMVTVKEGKVRVADSIVGHVILTRGEAAIHDFENKKITKKSLIGNPEPAWINGGFVFKNQTLTEIAKTLERRFPVKIVFARDDLSTYRFTGTYNNTPTLQKIMDDISLTMQLKYKIEENTVSIF